MGQVQAAGMGTAGTGVVLAVAGAAGEAVVRVQVARRRLKDICLKGACVRAGGA